MRKIILPNQTYFITTNIQNRYRLFVYDQTNMPRNDYCDVLIKNLNFYRKLHSFLFHGFVIMPDHIHLLITVGEKTPLPKIMRDWKSRTSFELNLLLNRRGRLWQRDYWAYGIRSERDFEIKLEYIHQNPVRAGLAQSTINWHYSSARWYEELSCCIPIDGFE